MFFEFNVMSNRRYSLNNSSRPSGSAGTSGSAVSPAPAPASYGGASSASTASKNSGNSGILLGISGGWLVTRMIFVGGVLFPLEIIAIIVTAGFVYPKGGKTQKRFATAIIAIAILNLFIPGINPGVKQIRETQLNSPGEMAHIVINRDGEYELPNRPLKVCFIMTGDPKINFYLDHRVSIGGNIFVQREDECQNLPASLNGSVSIYLLSGRPYSQEVKDKLGMQDINNNYEYYMRIGFGGYPTIQAR
jgi:hypothetical protein